MAREAADTTREGGPRSCADNRLELLRRTHTTTSAGQGPDEDRPRRHTQGQVRTEPRQEKTHTQTK